MPPCGVIQQWTSADVTCLLTAWARAHPDFCVGGNEAGMKLGRDVRGADAAVWRRGDLGAATAGFARVPPVLAVEVAGREEREGLLRDKARWYLDAGVEVVWLVLPETREVLVLTRDAETRHGLGQTLGAHPTLPASCRRWSTLRAARTARVSSAGSGAAVPSGGPALPDRCESHYAQRLRCSAGNPQGAVGAPGMDGVQGEGPMRLVAGRVLAGPCRVPGTPGRGRDQERGRGARAVPRGQPKVRRRRLRDRAGPVSHGLCAPPESEDPAQHRHHARSTAWPVRRGNRHLREVPGAHGLDASAAPRWR